MSKQDSHIIEFASPPALRGAGPEPADEMDAIYRLSRLGRQGVDPATFAATPFRVLAQRSPLHQHQKKTEADR